MSGTTNQCFSLCLSPSLSLSKNKIKKIKRKNTFKKCRRLYLNNNKKKVSIPQSLWPQGCSNLSDCDGSNAQSQTYVTPVVSKPTVPGTACLHPSLCGSRTVYPLRVTEFQQYETPMPVTTGRFTLQLGGPGKDTTHHPCDQRNLLTPVSVTTEVLTPHSVWLEEFPHQILHDHRSNYPCLYVLRGVSAPFDVTPTECIPQAVWLWGCP